MKKIRKEDVAKLLARWGQDFSVCVPARETGVAEMTALDGPEAAFPDWYRNTVTTPKAVFQPYYEKLFGFRRGEEGLALETPEDGGKQHLIFGIRPCDARAAAIVDLTFRDGYEDGYYLGRRQRALLVGLGCTRPYDSCFCTSLGLSPAEAADVDLMLTDLGDELLIAGASDRGKELLAQTDGLAEATPEDEARAARANEAAGEKVTRRIDVAEIRERFPDSFENQELWEKLAAKCVSCGVCTFLCPTCYCFDINDEKTGEGGARYRNWDCCSFPTYTKMPAENPRAEKWRRVRQKVHHKYTFYPALFDVIACTGCGRCIRFCPVNWDITQTLVAASAAPGEKANAD